MFFKERCSLCGGKLDSGNVCTECGLDNNKSEKHYRVNRSSCDGQPLTHVHQPEYDSRRKDRSRQEREQKEKERSALAQSSGSRARSGRSRKKAQPYNTYIEGEKRDRRSRVGKLVTVIIILVIVVSVIFPLVDQYIDESQYDSYTDYESYEDYDYDYLYNNSPELFEWNGAELNLGKTKYDYAYTDLGENWRLPTTEEWMELRDNCKWEADIIDNNPGFRVKGPNGNSIFIPGKFRYEPEGGSYAFEVDYFSSRMTSLGVRSIRIVGTKTITGFNSTLVDEYWIEDTAFIRPVCD